MLKKFFNKIHHFTLGKYHLTISVIKRQNPAINNAFSFYSFFQYIFNLCMRLLFIVQIVMFFIYYIFSINFEELYNILVNNFSVSYEKLYNLFKNNVNIFYNKVIDLFLGKSNTSVNQNVKIDSISSDIKDEITNIKNDISNELSEFKKQISELKEIEKQKFITEYLNRKHVDFDINNVPVDYNTENYKLTYDEQDNTLKYVLIGVGVVVIAFVGIYLTTGITPLDLISSLTSNNKDSSNKKDDINPFCGDLNPSTKAPTNTSSLGLDIRPSKVDSSIFVDPGFIKGKIEIPEDLMFPEHLTPINPFKKRGVISEALSDYAPSEHIW